MLGVLRLLALIGWGTQDLSGCPANGQIGVCDVLQVREKGWPRILSSTSALRSRLGNDRGGARPGHLVNDPHAHVLDKRSRHNIIAPTLVPFSELQILNPKRESETRTGRASWYPYYAGFSERFAHTLIASSGLPIDSLVTDPWNGSGTTTAAAAGMGHRAFGYDLNPVMVLAARARMLSKREKSSLVPIGTAIRSATKTAALPEEPLATWFTPRTAAGLRSIERAIQQTLMTKEFHFSSCSADHVKGISDLAAFFYVALFRTTRSLLQPFRGTNPTWVRIPTSPNARLRPTVEQIHAAFARQVEEMAHAIDEDSLTRDSEVQISLGSSSQLPLDDATMDFVLSSPPYCTRIDYAVATQPELALLGYRMHAEFDDLRRQLIGTSTVPDSVPPQSRLWGETCLRFLERLSAHPSKASGTYYLKNHLQYFNSIYRSVGEISRTLKDGGTCVLVVQDSYYKDIHNNVPKIVEEMAGSQSLQLRRKESFGHRRTMAGINPGVRRYRSDVQAIETVLCFSRTQRTPLDA